MQAMFTRRTALRALLVLAVGVVAFTAWNAYRRFLRFRAATFEPVAPWMSIGYAARSWGVSPRDLHDALGLTEDKPDFRPLGEIGRDLGFTEAEFMAQVEAKLKALSARQGDGGEAPKP